MSDDPAHVYAALGALGIPYCSYDHPAVYTADQAAEHWASIPATPVKNLFLRNKKGDRHYLVILPVGKHADLKHIATVVGDDRLSFGSPERLAVHLGLSPGAVSPFGLINDASGDVQVVVDADLREAEALIFHPNVNTVSLAIAVSDFERFLASRQNAVRWVRV